MVVASCGNKYYGTNVISAVPTSLLIAPGFRTIQLLFLHVVSLQKEDITNDQETKLGLFLLFSKGKIEKRTRLVIVVDDAH
jgi:hypothetical protein